MSDAATSAGTGICRDFQSAAFGSVWTPAASGQVREAPREPDRRDGAAARSSSTACDDLADVGGLRLLRRLKPSAFFAGTLAPELGRTRDEVAKQRKLLERAGVLQGERLGRRVGYARAGPAITSALGWPTGLRSTLPAPREGGGPGGGSAGRPGGNAAHGGARRVGVRVSRRSHHRGRGRGRLQAVAGSRLPQPEAPGRGGSGQGATQRFVPQARRRARAMAAVGWLRTAVDVAQVLSSVDGPCAARVNLA